MLTVQGRSLVGVSEISEATNRPNPGDIAGDRMASSNHAVDILELWEKAWFGPSNGFSINTMQSDLEPTSPATPPASSPGTLGRRHSHISSNGTPLTTNATSGHRSSSAQTRSLHRNLNESDGKDIVKKADVPISSSMSCSANQSRQAAIIQELPGIGTWAGRQRLFELPRSNAPPPPSAFEALVDACVDNTKLAQNHSPNDSVDSLKEGGLSSNQKDFTSGGSGAGSGAGSGRPNGYANGHVSGNADGENVGNGVITNGYAETVLANGINLDRGGLRNFGTRSCDSGGSQKSNDSEEQMNLAWRWRFTRKWEAEQRRALNGGDPLEEGADDDLDALRYVQACGVGLDLQVTKPRRPSQSRNICVGGHGRQHRMANGSHAGLVVAPLHSSASMSTMQFEVDASYIGSDLLGHEDSGILHSTPTPIAETPDAESTSAPATRDILSVAFRGKELMEAQKEIEKAAMARWEQIERACSGSVWAGANLTAVEIDMYGRFIYVLLRVYEPTSGSNTGRQRFLVRGHQGSTPKELMEIVVRQIAGVCASQGLPIPMVDMVGLGVLEWRQDTDRHVVLSSADALTINQYKGLNGNDYTVDVSGLAASLVRQSLPCHFLVRQEKTGSSSFPGTLAI